MDGIGRNGREGRKGKGWREEGKRKGENGSRNKKRVRRERREDQKGWRWNGGLMSYGRVYEVNVRMGEMPGVGSLSVTLEVG